MEKRLASVEAKLEELISASASYCSTARLERCAETTGAAVQNSNVRTKIIEKHVKGIDPKGESIENDVAALNAAINKLERDKKKLKEDNEHLDKQVVSQQDAIRMLQCRVHKLEHATQRTDESMDYLDSKHQTLSSDTLVDIQRYIDLVNVGAGVGLQAVLDKTTTLESRVSRLEDQEEAVLNAQEALHKVIKEIKNHQRTSKEVKELKDSFDSLTHFCEDILEDSALNKERLYDLEQVGNTEKRDIDIKEISQTVRILKHSFDGLWDLYHEQRKEVSHTHERLCDLEQSEHICVASNLQIGELFQDRDSIQFKIQNLEGARKSMGDGIEQLLQARKGEAEIRDTYNTLSIDMNNLSAQNKDLQERVGEIEDLIDSCDGDTSRHLKAISDRAEATQKEKTDMMVQRILDVMKDTTYGTYPEIDRIEEKLGALLIPSTNRDQSLEQLYDVVHTVTDLTHDRHDWLTKVSLALLEKVAKLSKENEDEKGH